MHLAAEGVSVDGGGGDGVGDLRGTLERGEDVGTCVFVTRWISGQGGGFAHVSGLHIGRSTQILRVAEGIYAFARGRTGEGEQDGDDDESGGKPAGRWRRTPASGGTGGTLRHLSRRRVTEVASGRRGARLVFFSPLDPLHFL